MHAYILMVVFIAGNGGGHRLAMQEFSSEKTCMAAAEKLESKYSGMGGPGPRAWCMQK